MSILNHLGLSKLDPHHNLDKAGNKLSGTAHKVTGAVSSLDPTKIFSQVETKIERFVDSLEKKVERQANRLADDIEHGAEEVIGRGRKEMRSILHDAREGIETAGDQVRRGLEDELPKLAERVTEEASRRSNTS